MITFDGTVEDRTYYMKSSHEVISGTISITNENPLFSLVIDGESITITNLRIILHCELKSPPLIFIRAANTIIQSCEFYGNGHKNNCIVIYNNYNVIRECCIIGFGRGILLYGNNNTVAGNVIRCENENIKDTGKSNVVCGNSTIFGGYYYQRDTIRKNITKELICRGDALDFSE